MFSAQCKMVTSCSTIGTLKCPCNNVSGFRGLEIFDRVIQKITNGRFETLPNYLPSKVVIPGSYFETQNFSGTSEQRTNTCNDIQTRRCAVAEKARALRSESGSGSETGCVSVFRPDPDSDLNRDPNSHFDFNQNADQDSDPDFFLDSHPNSDPDKVCDPDWNPHFNLHYYWCNAIWHFPVISCCLAFLR